MKTVGIVCEYNPFHTGHLYHFQQIRKDLGEDTAIICVMSGNYVQRGLPALLDKFTRAKIAILCGADLILELPYPFSCSGAGYFSDAAIAILDKLCVVDILSFGTESRSIETLRDLSDIAGSSDRELRLRQLITDPANAGKGYAELRSIAYFEQNSPQGPNDTLAIEYLRSLKQRHSSIDVHHVVRTCPHIGYFDGKYASASTIRALCLDGNMHDALTYIPDEARPIFEQEVKDVVKKRSLAFQSALLAHFRLNAPLRDTFELPEELRRRLIKFAITSPTYSDLVRSVHTARYTTSRVQRGILHAFLGTTSSHIRTEPAYTQVLAMNSIGITLLKRIKKQATIDILTKPADRQKLCDVAKLQHAHCARADSVYPVFSSDSIGGDVFLRTTPYCES